MPHCFQPFRERPSPAIGHLCSNLEKVNWQL
jgi:hypothetical protein